MKDIPHCGWAAETDISTYVGLHHAAPDTVVMIFQRPGAGQGDIRTTMLPLSIEAFRTLIVLGKRLIETVDTKKGGK